jgi:hypothetical protein
VEKPPESKGPGDPDLELVTVLEGNDPLLIAAAKDSLRDADIPFYVLGEEIAPRIGTVGGYIIHPWCRIQVGCDRETEALALLRPIKEVYSSTGAAGE